MPRIALLSTALLLAACGLLPALATEESVGLAQVIFVTSPKWYAIRSIAVDGEVLIFRKYSYAMIDGKMGGAEKTKNIFDFGCQRNRRYSDYLVFHLPSWARTGLEDQHRVPRLPVRIALNELRLTFDAEGEYKNSSIFIDLNDQQAQNIFKLIAADQMIIDYGVSEERLNIEQRTRTPDGKGDVTGFIEEFVFNVLAPSIGGSKVAGFDTDRMLKACMSYKRNGHLP